jgi:Myo-inositol oxygenase
MSPPLQLQQLVACQHHQCSFKRSRLCMLPCSRIAGFWRDVVRPCALPCASLPTVPGSPAAGWQRAHVASACSCGAQPEWTVTGESYPLGCAFSDRIRGAQFLCACPDRRCRAYSSPLGIYSRSCGLDQVAFTWSGPEFVSLVLQQPGVCLPFEALFVLRYQNFDCAIADDGAYAGLMTQRDRDALPLLRRFVAARAAARRGTTPPTLDWNATCAQCNVAMRRYFEVPQLHW